MIKRLLMLGVCICAGTFLYAGDLPGLCGPPPKAKRTRMKAGEAFAPLPLPVTPLRRSERKKPPSPPVLIAKVRYGRKRTGVTADGRTYTYGDWECDRGDIPHLLEIANSALNMNYTWRTVSLPQLTADPTEIPVIYFTGHVPIHLDTGSLENLKRFVLAGGTVFVDACCGSTPFTESFETAVYSIFPDRPLVRIPQSHPVFRSFYTIKKVTYVKGVPEKEGNKPALWGFEIGCRMAMIFTKYDLSCGWDGHPPNGPGYAMKDARRIGVNMIAYALSQFKLARFLASKKIYYEEEKPAGGSFIFTQVKYRGNWNPTPYGAVNLMKELSEHSRTDLIFKKDVIEIEKGSNTLFEKPLLYITGHNSFRISGAFKKNLKKYLDRGGFLMSESCCGSADFDVCMRSLFQELYPGELAVLGPDHPVYSSLNRIHEVRYSSLVRKEDTELSLPILEGITRGKNTFVIHSRFGLGEGWQGVLQPYYRGYMQNDALKIGSNIVIYALSH